TFKALERNLALNSVRNVRALNVAASDVEGTVGIFRGPESNIGLATAVPAITAKDKCLLRDEVPAAPLTDILNDDEMETARLIKIDVEGMEWAVIAGMKPILDSGRRDLEIAVEID